MVVKEREWASRWVRGERCVCSHVCACMDPRTYKCTYQCIDVCTNVYRPVVNIVINGKGQPYRLAFSVVF